MMLALTAVVLAAMGSHLVDMKGLQASWETASNMHLFSAAALVGLASLIAVHESKLLRWGAWLVISGTIIFSGSIYLHVMTGHTLRAVTPSGGVLMMLGWLLAALSFLRRP
jgi:uncharacterized membrane protein YgdD (TMEM256/DUF423 family)